MLRERIAPATLLRSDDVRLPGAAGLPGAAKEAFSFAILAYETWHGRPGNLPAATGARYAVVLGSITPGKKRSNG
ncbi:MAG: Anhydro-N-acetylmuramic acid kinase [Chloroflexi bacterium ADurb.Bin222]|nr:MAG: Anhydro-N-acetylmuramic acid kinase [Chloroflexi bacterium ADurb.Bin222]